MEVALSLYKTWTGQWWKGVFISHGHSFTFGSMGISSFGAGHHWTYLFFHHRSLWNMYITYLWGLIQGSLVKMSDWIGLFVCHRLCPTLRGDALKWSSLCPPLISMVLSPYYKKEELIQNWYAGIILTKTSKTYVVCGKEINIPSKKTEQL